MSLTSSWSRIERHVDAGLGLAAGALLLGMMLLTVVDVMGRYLFNAPLPAAFELTEVGMALLIFAGLPHASRVEGHVTVTLITDHLPLFLKRTVDALSNLFVASVLALLSWRVWLKGDQLADYGDVTVFLRMPLAPVAWTAAILLGLAAMISLKRSLMHLSSTRPTEEE